MQFRYISTMRICCASLVAVALAAGCASTPEGLKSDPSKRRSFIVAGSYQLVFKRIVETNRECSPSAVLPIGQAIADAQLYPDLKTGTLVLGASGIGTQIHQTVEIREDEPGLTQVVVYAATSADRFTARYKKWASGNADCKLD